MSKIINALKDVEQQRIQKSPEGVPPDKGQPQPSLFQTDSGGSGYRNQENFLAGKKGAPMKNQWLIWGLVAVVIGIVFFAFNYQGGRQAVPLSEIFPEPQEEEGANVEYVYMGQPSVPTAPEGETGAEAPAPEKSVAPAAPAVAKVLPTAVPIAPPAREQVTLPAGGYTIQVASFRKKEYAEKVVREMTEAGHAAFLKSKDLQDKGVWYRVYVGTFPTKEEAQQYLPKLKKSHKDSFVLHL